MQPKLLKFSLLFLVLSLNSGAVRGEEAVLMDGNSYSNYLSDAINAADLVFDGTVIAKQTRRSDASNGPQRIGHLYTYYTYAIWQIFKGSLAASGSSLTLRLDSADRDAQGKLGVVTIFGTESEYGVGDRAILFMKNDGSILSPGGVPYLLIPRPGHFPLRPGKIFGNTQPQQAWLTPQFEIVYEPTEEDLLGLIQRIKDEYEESKPTPMSYEKFFHMMDSMNNYSDRLNGTLHSDGVWTPRADLIPYDQELYAEHLRSVVEAILESLAAQGNLQKIAPFPNIDIVQAH